MERSSSAGLTVPGFGRESWLGLRVLSRNRAEKSPASQAVGLLVTHSTEKSFQKREETVGTWVRKRT